MPMRLRDRSTRWPIRLRPFPGKDKGVIDLTHSPYAKLKTVPVSAVVIQEGFWSKRRQTNVQASIPSMYDELIAHGRNG